MTKYVDTEAPPRIYLGGASSFGDCYTSACRR
ncbi:TPA_asm: hypothetical protein PROPHIFSQJ01-1_94 [Mycobacterium phage prophiFSQJ01-1]|nr:TPA_asm: hypothetical protein PROPHIFSQJ01-1_94 [Mycobacterium phage prophiFSQJ01-1]